MRTKIRAYLFVACCITVTLSFAQSNGGKEDDKEIQDILKKYGCKTCHHKTLRVVGPSFTAIAKRNYTTDRMVELIFKPEPANWIGYPEMPAIDTLQRQDINRVAEWIRRLEP
jgi:cytochrome c551/c552